MKGWMAGAVVLIGITLVAAWWRGTPHSPNVHARAASFEDAASVGAGRTSGAPTTAADLRLPRAAPQRFQPLPAWKTMADAREHGDDRAPPIERPLPESQGDAPSAWDLSDPSRYREYELRGQRRLRAEYLMAAETELPKWKDLLAQARATGAPRAAIAEAEDKIRHLEARMVALRNSEPGN